MKKIGLISIVAAALGVVGMYWQYPAEEIIKAQASEVEDQKRIERDKRTPNDRVDRAAAEAGTILKDLQVSVKAKFPKYSIHRSFVSDPYSAGIGRKGQVRIESTWRTTQTQISMDITFVFDEAGAIKMHKRSTDGISMGEFFPAPDFVGDEGILVKNAQFNKKNTSVGLHFVKGRAIVSSYITNYSRKAEKNEKELIEFVRTIEPLIKAKTNFDDL